MIRDSRPQVHTFRYTLRSLLIVGLAVSLVLGWWSQRHAHVTLTERFREVAYEKRGLEKLLKHYNERQRVAVERIRQLGARPQLTTARGLVVEDPADEQIVCVPYVDLSNPAIDGEAIRSMIPYLKDLIPSENEPGKHYVALQLSGNPHVEEHHITELRNLPNCEFSKWWCVPTEVMRTVEVGMKQEQVVSKIASLVKAPVLWEGSKRRLGLPSQTYSGTSGLQSWAYYTDEAGVGIYGIDFDANGRVIATWVGRGAPPPERMLTLLPRFQAYQ